MQKVTVVDATEFQKLAGNAAFLVAVADSGDEEILVPDGAVWENDMLPETQITALISLRSASYYTKCKNHRIYVCCGNVCVKTTIAC